MFHTSKKIAQQKVYISPFYSCIIYKSNLTLRMGEGEDGLKTTESW